jgi:hypothetical protein
MGGQDRGRRVAFGAEHQVIHVAVHEIELAPSIEDRIELSALPAGDLIEGAEVGPEEHRDLVPSSSEFLRQGVGDLGGAAGTGRQNARRKGRHPCDPQDLALRRGVSTAPAGRLRFFQELSPVAAAHGGEPGALNLPSERSHPTSPEL